MADPKKPEASPDDLSFEEALARLESVVARLEDGELDLEHSLASFEEGVRLVKLCSGRLQAAQLRVRQLEESADGPVERELEEGG